MSKRFVYYNAGIAAALLMLDLFPDAEVGHSLRKLRNGYTGSCIRVRRSSDNAEQDIGFNSNNTIDLVTLNSFVGSDSAYIVIWYDQSLNGNNFIQSVQLNQFRIVVSGVTETSNGFPTIYAYSLDSSMESSSLSHLSEGEMFMIVEGDTIYGSKASWNFGSDIQVCHYPYISTDIYENFGSNTRRGPYTPVTDIGDMNIYNVLSANNNWKVFVNNEALTAATSNVVSFSTSPILGKHYGRNSSQFKITELIIYPTNKDTDRGDIKTSLNDYYAMY